MTQIKMVFDQISAEKLADRGIALAEAKHSSQVGLARDIAEQIAKRKGTVTTDDIRREFVRLHLDWLGNAAGSIFRDSRFEFAGDYIKSTVVVGHGNLIRVWKLRK